jgi:hypothetical protein
MGDSEARASLKLPPVRSESQRQSNEEASPAIREAVLEAIQAHMFKVGRFPRRAILASTIVSIAPSQDRYALLDSDWAYKTRVRVNLDTYSVEHDYLVFQRGTSYVVRKTSL